MDRTRRWAGPAELRLLAPVPTGSPVVAVPAVRTSDQLPVTVVIVTAALDTATRKRVRTESAELEARLADVDPNLVLPLLDHGVAADRPYLVLPRPGPTLDAVLAGSGPLPAPEVGAAARVLVDGLRMLAARHVPGPPPTLYRTARDGVVLGTPLPPVIAELAPAHDHEPPEVLRGGDWTPAGQVYACASLLWTLLAGRPPFDSTEDGRLARLRGDEPPRLRRADLSDLVGITLSAGLSANPEIRPADLGLLADVFVGAQADERQHTRPPTHLPLSRMDIQGRRLGSGYELDREIGRGAMGRVWAGRRVADGSPVAVKLLHRELAEDTEVVRRFLRELTTLRRLDHDNLVRVHDLVAEGGELGLVMDLVDGEDLRKHAGRGALTVPEAAGLLAQTAEALAAVHAAGVVHRDLKPENILVTQRNGRPAALLSDFGIALPTDARFTQLVCTPAYVAPELVEGRPPAPPADVYALGITAYELLAGRRPFSARNTAALLHAHRTQPVARPDGMADPVWHLISACLDKQPERRPSAKQAAAGWATLARPGVLDGLPVPPQESTVDSEPAETWSAQHALRSRPADVAPRSRRRWPWVVASATVVAVGAAIGVYLAIPKSPGPSADPPSLQYPVAATMRIDGPNTATIQWSADAATLPGFQNFLLIRTSPKTNQSYQVGPNLPNTATSYQVTELRPGQEVCFQVIAYGVTTPPPNPPPPKLCTPPGDEQSR